MRSVNSLFVMSWLPTTATELEGTLFLPLPPHPAARTTTSTSAIRGRKRSSLIGIPGARMVRKESRCSGDVEASRCLASFQDSIDQPDRLGETILAAQADLTVPGGVDRGV